MLDVKATGDTFPNSDFNIDFQSAYANTITHTFVMFTHFFSLGNLLVKERTCTDAMYCCQIRPISYSSSKLTTGIEGTKSIISESKM